MKKLKVIGLLILILMPIDVYAANSLSVSCSPKEIISGGNVTCTFTGHSDSEIDKITATLSSSNGITVSKYNGNSNWSGSVSSGNIQISWNGDNSTQGDLSLGSVDLNLGDSSNSLQPGQVSFGLSNVKFYLDDEGTDVGNASDTFTIIASEPMVVEKGLATLQAEHGVLSPSLSDNNTGYSIMLNNADTNSFRIIATAKNAADTIRAINADNSRELNLDNIIFNPTGGNSGMNIELTVGSGENAVVYNILVQKPVSNDVGKAELKTLTVGGKSVELVSGTHDYVVELDSVDSYTIVATLKDSENFKFDSFFDPNSEYSGAIEIPITIVPKESTSGYSSVTYKITVKKKSATPATSSKKSTASGGGSNTNKNPGTFGGSAIAMALVLILSLGASIYFYKRNINEYN